MTDFFCFKNLDEKETRIKSAVSFEERNTDEQEKVQ